MTTRHYSYDFFISHASEDKARLARPLAKCLRQVGFTAWLDEDEILPGNSLARSIEHGLRHSRFALLLATENFFDPKKYWTHGERDALMALEAASQSRIVPVLHGMAFASFREQAPLLAGRLVLNTSAGLGSVIAKVAPLFRERDTSLTQDIAKKHLYPFWRGNATVHSKTPRNIEVAAELLRFGDELHARWYARSTVEGKFSEDSYSVLGRVTNNEFVSIFGEHASPTALNQGFALLRKARSDSYMAGLFVAVSRNSEEIVGGTLSLQRVTLGDG